VNAEAIAAMKPSAFLINLGRGAVVDEAALTNALQTEKIAGAALDVFSVDPDPLPKANPLWGMKNVIITPRVGGATDIYPDQVLPIIEENLQRFLQGERRDLINVVEWS
jgi:D-2-hydroxyacid dehydrogenase (NADP+)